MCNCLKYEPKNKTVNKKKGKNNKLINKSYIFGLTFLIVVDTKLLYLIHLPFYPIDERTSTTNLR